MLTGLIILVLGTYANLYATEETMSKPDSKPGPVINKEPRPIPKDILKKGNVFFFFITVKKILLIKF